MAADISGQRVGRDRRRNAFQGVGTDAVAGFVFSGAPVDKLLLLGRIERLERACILRQKDCCGHHAGTRRVNNCAGFHGCSICLMLLHVKDGRPASLDEFGRFLAR